MPIGCFVDKTRVPSAEEICEALGPAFPLWEALLQFIETNYQIPGALTYGGKNYGWNLWYRKSGKALASLYPQRGCFVAQVVLGKDQVAKALDLPLGEPVARLLRETPQLHDGKWLFISVTSPQDERDVEQLLLVKKRPVKKRI